MADTPFTFKQPSLFKADDNNTSHKLSTHGFCVFTDNSNAKGENYIPEAGKALLSHMIANAADTLEPIFRLDDTLPKTPTKAAALTMQLSHFFNMSSGHRVPASVPGKEVQRYSAAHRYPHLTHGALTTHLQSSSRYQDAADLEAYICTYLSKLRVPQRLWGPEYEKPIIELRECIHTLKHSAEPSRLIPVCPINPLLHEPTSDSYMCHMAITDIPFVPIRTSHNSDFLGPLQNILRGCVSEDDQNNMDAAFELPYVTSDHAIDPLSIFQKQLALSVKAGDLVVCDRALSTVPLAYLCSALHQTPQWACSFVINKPGMSAIDSLAETPATSDMEEEGPPIISPKNAPTTKKYTKLIVPPSGVDTEEDEDPQPAKRHPAKPVVQEPVKRHKKIRFTAEMAQAKSHSFVVPATYEAYNKLGRDTTPYVPTSEKEKLRAAIEVHKSGLQLLTPGSIAHRNHQSHLSLMQTLWSHQP